MTHYSRPQVIFEKLKSRHALLFQGDHDTEKFAIIRFCIHETKMAFETPFAPRGLHF